MREVLLGPTNTEQHRLIGPPTAEFLQTQLPQYEIVRLLGQGGMGAVYLGRQPSLDRQVAIKVLPASLQLDDPSFAERFKNEARALARLSHPGIVNVFEFGETADGLLYFVMEYVEGKDVQQMLQEGKRLRTEWAMFIAAHVCDALAYAHHCGIIHRDIKPSNIIMGKDGRVKVADFGLAKIAMAEHSPSITKNGEPMGTLHYMAPEAHIPGMQVDHRADIYAVGVMLYHMLTGKVPQGMFELPSIQVPGLDPRFDDIIARALRNDREARYESVAALRSALNHIVTSPVQKASADKPAAHHPPAPPASVPAQCPATPAAPSLAKSHSWGKYSTATGVTATLLLLGIGGFLLQPQVPTGQGTATPKTSPTPNTDPHAADWKPLFINDTLLGWHGDTRNYQFKDGVLSSKSGATDLVSDDEFGSFHLTFEVKLSAGTNSGIGIWREYSSTRTLSKESGFEVQIQDDTFPGYQLIAPIGRHGGIYNFLSPSAFPMQSVGTWNRHEIIVKDTQVTVIINDQPVVDTDVRLLTPMRSRRTPVDVTRKRGRLVIMGNIGVVEFRNLRIRELDPVPVQPRPDAPPKPIPQPTLTNSLGMKFIPLPGTDTLICIHETRRQDYAAYAKAEAGVNPDWIHVFRLGVPVSYDDTHPVVNTSWIDAKAFCAWLSKKEGRRYRLLTDREWSIAIGIAAKEPTGLSPAELGIFNMHYFSWGTEWPPPPKIGNICDASHHNAFSQHWIPGYQDQYATTSPVMSFPPNELGIYDLVGNVWEWCEDWFDSSQVYRVARGAHFGDYKTKYFVSSYRATRVPGSRMLCDGFRIALEPGIPSN